MLLYDAHNHLHDARLRKLERAALLRQLDAAGVQAAGVNGTEPGDWQAVADCRAEAKEVLGRAFVVASYGLHPWKVAEAKGDWLADLEQRLRDDPAAGVGEVGLDGWIEGADIEAQEAVLRPQVELAAELNRAVTFHCLHAWQPFMKFLADARLPERGFLVHSPGASPEIIEQIAQKGGYCSVSGYFLAPQRKQYQRAMQAIPADRLLIETDAPDMLPPEATREHTLDDPSTGEALNHPANLLKATF